MWRLVAWESFEISEAPPILFSAREGGITFCLATPGKILRLEGLRTCLGQDVRGPLQLQALKTPGMALDRAQSFTTAWWIGKPMMTSPLIGCPLNIYFSACWKPCLQVTSIKKLGLNYSPGRVLGQISGPD